MKGLFSWSAEEGSSPTPTHGHTPIHTDPHQSAPPPHTPGSQAREFRRKSQANAAADARTLFRREAEWIVKQPKARQAKSQHRVKAFVELTARTKDVPKEDLKARRLPPHPTTGLQLVFVLVI